MPVSRVESVGRVCHEWDYPNRVCREQIDVGHVVGTDGVHFLSKLAVDADGAPRSYHPSDRSPDDNAARALDWLDNVNIADLHGIQGQNGARGPAPGFHISATSHFDPTYPANDTRRWVDAATIPYVVLPGRNLPLAPGMTLKRGCLTYVVDTRTGHATGAMYADTGRAVGEGSVALALRLGLRPFHPRVPPKVIGFSGKRFFYLVFPDTSSPPPWDASAIHARAKAAFERWGGEAQLRAILPTLPPLQPAIEGSRSMTEESSAGHGPAAPAHTLPDMERPPGRGADVSRSSLAD